MVPVSGVSSAVVSVWLAATGASFTGVTPMLTVDVVVPPCPSLTVTTKLSGPL